MSHAVCLHSRFSLDVQSFLGELQSNLRGPFRPMGTSSPNPGTASASYWSDPLSYVIRS
jgi:hypothetical protein